MKEEGEELDPLIVRSAARAARLERRGGADAD